MEGRNEDRFEVALPPCLSSEINVDRNRARQLLSPAGRASLDTDVSPPRLVREEGGVVRLVAGPSSVQTGERALKIGRRGLEDPVAALGDILGVRWIGDLSPQSPATVRGSWADSFEFTLEDPDRGQPGLRLAQLGAVHGVLGYWTTGSNQPATVVMPTGTGKTETMVALLATARPKCLLVIVPSDVLRTQIASTFEALGVLQEIGVLSGDVLYPVVGQIRHRFSSSEGAHRFTEQCNVIIATPSALFASPSEASQQLLGNCSHLFVDEAHHVEARTWRQIREAFGDRPVVQFTATPFREDGRRLAGRIVYEFPLRQAQKYGYFSRINYLSVVDFENPDRAVASRAIDRLREDLIAGHDHLMLARVKRIGRAHDIQSLYEELAPDLAPVLLHSSLPIHERRGAIEAIHARESRIIVCVDMLGEGFDLPALKVAAIHDPHKSIGVTLQFVGRFARVAGEDIGEATVVVGRLEARYDESLRKLYAEDADWNLIVRDLSEAAIGEEQEVSDFEAAFDSLPEEVSLRNVEPKMSTVVYRTQCESWQPEAISELYSEDQLFTDPLAVNEQSHVAWFVVESRSPVRWGDLETVAEVSYDLYLLYWDESKQLLYINSSNTESVYEELAKAVCGENVRHVTGEDVYRVMANVKRLVPTNVGVLDVRNRSRRFSMHVGADVIEGFPVAEAQTKTKTNIFAYGYEDGARVSIGGSLRGRVWSYRVARTIKHWMNWCDHVGAKVNDAGISVDEVMRGFIRPETVESRPPYVALGIEWPWEIYLNLSEETRVEHEGSNWPLIDVDLGITNFSNTGAIPFAVSTPDWGARYEMEMADGRIMYRPAGAEAEVITRQSRTPLSEYLNEAGPSILFEQDAMVVPPGIFLKPDRELESFDPHKLVALDWSGIDLRKESQGPNHDPDSIQARAIEHVQNLADWELLIDDDGTGEVADIVAMQVDEDRLVVKLVHCKYSSEATPGARVEDLYAVCGQTQKSVRWRRDPELLFRRLIQRERNRLNRQRRSGFMVGDGNRLYELEERARMLKPEFSATIAQPGLSKSRASRQQLDLLASTDVYLYETAHASLDVLCSE